MTGYLSLWTVYWLFRLLTGKEALGYGDFKLLAALGAWSGWRILPQTLLCASASGLIWTFAATADHPPVPGSAAGLRPGWRWRAAACFCGLRRCNRSSTSPATNTFGAPRRLGIGPGRPARHVWDNAPSSLLHLAIGPLPESAEVAGNLRGRCAGDSSSSTSAIRPGLSSAWRLRRTSPAYVPPARADYRHGADRYPARSAPCNGLAVRCPASVAMTTAASFVARRTSNAFSAQRVHSAHLR